jgi:hypothetical protein
MTPRRVFVIVVIAVLIALAIRLWLEAHWIEVRWR